MVKIRKGSFSDEQRRAIVSEGQKVGVKAVLAKYGISDQSYRNWHYRIQRSQAQETALSNGEA